MTTAENTIQANQLGPNFQLIGQNDARHRLNTPALLVDMDVLDRNILKMADFVSTAGFSLRPHAKCHKSVSIAKRQLRAGAIGLCCASIGEAEVMGYAGIQDLLITSPLVTEEKMTRFCTLAQQIDSAKTVVDNPENVEALSVIAVAADIELKILVDIDPGMRRTGVSGRSTTVKLAKMINSLPNLVFYGLQCYAGHIQHVADYDKRRELSQKIMDEVAGITDTLIEEGLPPVIISGGGTGTFDIDAQSGVLTELQAGSYIFMDAQYNNVWINDGTPPPFETSLFVQTTVTSANHTGLVTTDAGLKQFAVDGGLPVPVKGLPNGGTYNYAGDEHGFITLPETGDSLPMGTRIECAVPHCDPTVNLYNVIHCFRGDALVDIWPVDARGA